MQRNPVDPGKLDLGSARCNRRLRGLLVLLLLLGLILYLHHAFQFFLNDDEGTYAYASWRISLGEVPYRDFLTSEMPAFLYWGGLLVRLFGRSFVALRVVTMLATLAAGCLLYATNRELFGYPVALTSLGLFLVEPNVFACARYFRAEAYMLVFQLAGTYAFVLGEKRQRLRYTILASFFFGLSILNKLFGLLPLAGCFIYLMYAWRREHRPLMQVVREALALGTPALLLLATASLVFAAVTPYFFTAVLGHHMMQGAGMPLAERAGKALELYGVYITGQPAAAAVALLGAGAVLQRKKALSSLPVWQVPTALAFAGFSRDLYVRYMVYLAPVLASLLAVALLSLLKARPRMRIRRRLWVIAWPAVLLVLTLGGLWPWMAHDSAVAAAQENDSPGFVALIQSLSAPNEVVLADYPGLNFLAGRRSTYWAAEMSRTGAESGQIRGRALIEEIKQLDVAAVLFHISKSDRQMSAMVDFQDFRHYVQSRFSFLGERAWEDKPRVFEIYARTDAMPVKPGLTYGDDIVLDGLRLEDETVASGSSLKLDWRWRALRTMAGDYHVSLCLVDASGQQWAEAHTQLIDPYTAGPTSAWSTGEDLLLRQQLTLNPAMPGGNYYLVVQAYRDGSGFVMPTGTWDGPTVCGVPVLARVRVLPPKEVPSPEDLPAGTRFSATPVDGLELVGGRLPGHIEAGERLGFSLYWHAPEQLSEDYELEFYLQEGAVVQQRWRRAVAEGLPTDEWRVGEVVVESYDLAVDQGVGAGECVLWVRVLDHRGREAGRVRLVPAPSADVEAPGGGEGAIAYPMTGACFGDYFGLLSYDLSTVQMTPGEKVAVTLYWVYRRPSPVDYTVFIHLLDEDSQIQGQVDLMPQGGGMLTSGWVMGDVLVDRFEVPLKDEARAGTLRLEVGFYDQATGERLPLERDGQAMGDDNLILPTTIAVESPA